jgi:outer membrane protein assembly factor BamB
VLPTLPLVADERVYVADDSGSVAALDESTGVTRWEVQLGGQVRGTPVLVGDLLIAGTSDGTVAALATKDGGKVWSHTVGPVIASLLVVDRAVVVVDGDGTLTAFDSRSGSTLWSMPLGAPMSHGPSLAAGVIYVGADDGTLTALDAASHQPRWIVKLGTGMLGTPTGTNNRGYLGRGVQDTGDTHDSRVDAHGRRRVEVRLTGWQADGRSAGSTAFADSEDNRVRLDAATGARWTHHQRPDQLLAAIVGDTSTSAEIERCGPGHRHRCAACSLGRRLPTTPAVIDGCVVIGRIWPRRGDRGLGFAVTAAGRDS